MKNRSFTFLSLLALGSVAAGGCSGRNIHQDLTDDPHILVRKWAVRTHGPFDLGDRGSEFSNPVVSENTLVFGNRSVGLIALYPSLNQQRWVLPIAGGVVSELAIDKGSVYFGGGDGFLYSVALDTGRVNWRYEVRNPAISKPTVAGGRVFITTTDDVVYAFDSGTGKWLWHYRRRSSPAATIYGASSPLVDGQEVLTGLSDGFLVCLSIADGQLKWERKLHQGSKFTDVDAHPVLENGIIYIPSYDGALYALKRQNGDILWRFDAGGSKTVVLEEDKVYLPSSDGNVYAISKSSGKMLWKFELDHGVPTQLVVTDRYVVMGSTFQYFYAIDKETGKGLYRYDVGNGSGFSGSPGYDSSHNRIYALSGAGNLYAFELTPLPRHVYPHAIAEPYKFDAIQ